MIQGSVIERCLFAPFGAFSGMSKDPASDGYFGKHKKREEIKINASQIYENHGGMMK